MRRTFHVSKRVVATLGESDPGTVGQCWDDGDAYAIVVDAKLDFIHAMDTLIHEWAHLMCCDHDPESFDLHDDAYWIRFGAIYRKILE